MAVRQRIGSRLATPWKKRRGTSALPGRALRFEALEDRQMLATITVTSLADDLTVNNQVTLREAIQAAELDTSVDGSAAGSGADTIEFHPSLGGTINLSTIVPTAAGPSALAITTPITIRGNTDGITIARHDAAPEMRLFHVATTGSLKLESLMLTGGVARGAAGTAILPNGGDGLGGAIYNEGTLQIVASALYGNQAHGGAAFVGGAVGVGRGGAVANLSGSTTIDNATLSGNAAYGQSGSPGPAFGGGVFNRNGALSIRHSTIADNTAVAGRGVYVFGDDTAASAVLELFSSIVGYDGPLDPEHTDVAVIQDGGGMVTATAAYNLIRKSVGLPGGSLSDAPPMLGPLADNGGPTWTRALLPGSSAIDAGDPTAVAGVASVPLFDQRGTGHSRVMDGDDSGGARIDVGAFEVQGESTAPIRGDYNGDGSIDAADYTVWRDQFGRAVTPLAGADGDGSGVVDADDYSVWKSNFGRSVPAASGTSIIESGDSTAEATATDTTAVQSLAFLSLVRGDGAYRSSNVVQGADGQLSASLLFGSRALLLETLAALAVQKANADLDGISAVSNESGFESEHELQSLDELWSEWTTDLV